MTALALLIMLALGVLAAPMVTAAQSRGTLPVVGVLYQGSAAAFVDPRGQEGWYAFLQGVRDLGYLEGQTIHLASRFAAWQRDRLSALAAALVPLQPAVIVTGTIPGVLAAKHATTTLPMVMAVGGDWVACGIVASLARPGGNITGQSLRGVELEGNR